MDVLVPKNVIAVEEDDKVSKVIAKAMSTMTKMLQSMEAIPSASKVHSIKLCLPRDDAEKFGADVGDEIEVAVSDGEIRIRRKNVET